MGGNSYHSQHTYRAVAMGTYFAAGEKVPCTLFHQQVNGVMVWSYGGLVGQEAATARACLMT